MLTNEIKVALSLTDGAHHPGRVEGVVAPLDTSDFKPTGLHRLVVGAADGHNLRVASCVKARRKERPDPAKANHKQTLARRGGSGGQNGHQEKMKKKKMKQKKKKKRKEGRKQQSGLVVRKKIFEAIQL